MKVLVIPDVHLKPFIFDYAEDLMHKNNIDTAIFIGDIVDDWGKQNNVELYEKTINRAIQFKHDYPNSKFCWGNHELGYITDIYCSGNSELHFLEIRDLLKKYEREVQPELAYSIDNIIFSHAGFCTYAEDAVKQTKKDGVYDGSIYDNMNSHISPVWLRPYPGVFYDTPQVVGHTPVEKIYQKDNIWVVDTYSTSSENVKIGDGTFLIIDTVTLEASICGEGLWNNKKD